MRRRNFIALVGGAMSSWPVRILAQNITRRPVVAILTSRTLDKVMLRYSNAFDQGMQESRLIAGQDYDLVLRSTETDATRVPKLLTELILLNPTVILTSDTPLTLAAKRATKEIPIIGVAISDPVGFGLVASLARPGGNVTGLLSSIDKLVPKQLDLLLQVVPTAMRIGVLFNASNPANAGGAHFFFGGDTAAQSVKPILVGLHDSNEIEAGFDTFASEHVDVVLVFQDSLFTSNADKVAALALARRLPTVFGFRVQVEAGGLMSYGINVTSQWHRAAAFAAKILKGVKPADLPVEMQPKLELVINLKTAKTLGLTIPASVMALATDVLE
jgi:putative tryptophan/tyrosine transport system substrate-binding protein